MQKARRPNNYFSKSCIHYQAEQIKKRSNHCFYFCQKYTRLNTVESICKVEQFHLHTSRGNSNVVFIL